MFILPKSGWVAHKRTGRDACLLELTMSFSLIDLV